MAARTLKHGNPLTAAQRDLLETAPDAAARAVAAVFREHGRILPDEEAKQRSEEAVERATQTFEVGEGQEFPRYAFWEAYRALLDAGRAEGRHERLKATLQAAFTAQRGSDPRPPREPAAKSFEEVEARAEAAPAKLAAKAMTWADEMLAETQGEERMVAREEVRAVRKVLGGLAPWEKRLLALRWVEDEKIESVAARLNVSVSTMQRRTTKLMARLEKRLATLGVTSMPRWLRVEGRGLLAEACGVKEPSERDDR